MDDRHQRDQWRSLGEELAAVLKGADLPPTTPPLREMITLPASTVLADALAALDRPQPAFQTAADLAGRRRFLEQRLEWAKLRDEIQAGRPEGCWCLGLGGRGERWIPGDPPTQCFDEYCGCPDGQATEALARTEFSRVATERQQARLNRLFAGAGLPAEFRSCTLDSYPVCADTAKAVADLRTWLAQVMAPDPTEPVLLLWGPYGVGKTGIAAGALRAWLDTGRAGLFVKTPVLLDRIRASYNAGTPVGTDELERQVRDAPCLVLDDIGAERLKDGPSGWAGERLFVLLDARHDSLLPTIVTSNLSPSALRDHLGERTIWRILHRACVIELNGPNLRAR